MSQAPDGRGRSLRRLSSATELYWLTLQTKRKNRSNQTGRASRGDQTGVAAACTAATVSSDDAIATRSRRLENTRLPSSIAPNRIIIRSRM